MRYVDTTQKLTAISMCPGLRGLERGVERAIGGIDVLAYVEIEAFIIANLVAEMEQGLLAPAPVWTDVKTFSGEGFRDKVHFLFAGYPCQPFSMAGNRLGTADPRHLFPYIHRFISTARPVCCFFENVEGHLSMGYDTVYQSLRALGYRVEAGIYSAEEAGAPHQRNRLFILAIREDELANPESFLWRLYESARWQCNIDTKRPSKSELAYTDSDGHEEGNGDRRTAGCPDKGERCHGERERVWDKPTPGCADELANSCSDGRTVPENRKRLETRDRGSKTGANDAGQPEGCSCDPGRYNEELGNTTEQGLQEPGHGGLRELSEKNRNGLYNRPEQPSGATMANTNSERSHESLGRRSPEQFEQNGDKRGDVANTCSRNERYLRGEFGEIPQEQSEPANSRWPARPGEEQYDWEAPRTIEPGMGCTVDGYNFREDLLRAYGNSVVEQTAEIAFIDLIKKHMQ